MTNLEIAKLLRKISAAYTILDEKKFRFQIIAYEKAADAVEHTTLELRDLWEEEKMGMIPGLGTAIQSHLDELFKTGKVKHFQTLTKDLPEAMFVLLDIPGFGPKRAYRLVKELGIKNPQTAVEDLKEAAKKGKIRVLEGFGEKSEADILERIARFRAQEAKLHRMTLPQADASAQRVLVYLRKHPDVKRADPLGSLRRMASTVGDIDIAVATKNPKVVLDYFVKYPHRRVLEKGTATATLILENGAQVDLMVQSPESYGALLQHFTGSKNHNIHLRELALKKGMSLSEYGIKAIGKAQPFGSAQGKSSKLPPEARLAKGGKVQNYNSKLKIFEFPNEDEFYKALGLVWIPPELREDTGEIEVALQQASFGKTQDKQGKPGGLPKLVELKDVKGDLHDHSNYNLEPSHDLGDNSFGEMIKKAEDLSYQYLAFTEHNPSITKHTEEQIISIMKERNKIIEQIKKSTKSIRIINMIEVDILPDGRLAMSDKALSELDGAIASVHSSFQQPREKMTERVLSALKNPYVKILGHPTGRLLGKREGYELDWNRVFESCLEYDKALEINAWPERLDLPDILVREAVKRGVKMVISTDAHRVSEMDLMFYGVAVARRGWAEKNDILNTMEYNEFIKWLHKRS